MHFLTEIDPNARVKGTRDPLGIQAVWTRFSRLVVGGFTSQTTSLNDFRILVMGSWLVDQIDLDKVPAASAFACWEQLTAYSRHDIRGERSYRGVTRVASRLAKSNEPIPISASRDAQILTNQAGYGIWGLYRSTAWSTGMLSMQRPYVSHPDVDEVVRSVYVPRLEAEWGKDLSGLLRLVTTGGEIRPWLAADRRRMAAVATTVAGPITAEERDLYRRFLIDAGPDDIGTNPPDVRHNQRILYRELLKRDLRRGILASDLEAIAAITNAPALASALEDIRAGGALFAAAARIFSFVSMCDRSSFTAELAKLERHFASVPNLLAPDHLRRLKLAADVNQRLMQAPGDKQGEPGRWLRIANALHDKDFPALVRLVLEQNLAVSRAKGSGAGWVTIGDAGTIKVSLPDPGPALSGWTKLGDPWIEPYYVANLVAIARELEAA